jgi:hypothetical protein
MAEKSFAEMVRAAYLKIRSPRYFLWILAAYVVVSVSAHFLVMYDADWGLTNLVLSIEASMNGAVITIAAVEGARATAEMLELVLKLVQDIHRIAEAQEKTLKGVVLIAEAQRDQLLDHRNMLEALKSSDERILKTLTEGEAS